MRWDSPPGRAIALGLFVVAAALLAHAALTYVDAASGHAHAEFTDAALVSIVFVPALYFLVFRSLRDRDERLALIQDCAQDAIVMADDTGRIVDWNPAAQRMFQYSREEALRRHIHDLLTPARNKDAAARGFARFARTGAGPLIGKTTELSALRKDGSEIEVEHSIEAARLKGRWHAIGIMRDISERRRAERALREHAERYRQLLDHIGSGVAVYEARNGGEDFVLVDMNREGARLSGVKREEVVGRSLLEVFPGAREMGLFAVLREVWKTGAPQHHSPSLYQDERFSRWFENEVYKLPSGELVAIYDDVTERRQADREKRQADIRLKDALTNAVGAIAATLEQRDPYTAGHERRVARLAVAIAKDLGLAADAVEGIHFGGSIHDIGKISVPVEILCKPGRITEVEFGLIKIHAEVGYDIVKWIDFPWPVADMVRQHHERLDGSGYPQGLKGEQIGLEARILAVADVVEAMLADRPYRAGLGIDAALDEITRARGVQLDAAAVDACLRVIREQGFAFSSA